MAQASEKENFACTFEELSFLSEGLLSDPTAWNPRPNWGPFWEARRYSAVLLVGVTLPVHPFFVLELSELLAGPQTCGQALVSPEGRRAKGKRTFRVPIRPGARSAREVCFYGTAR